ncbi:hypothetical protein ACXJJ3_30255 [Kribbella sp. WER1]
MITERLQVNVPHRLPITRPLIAKFHGREDRDPPHSPHRVCCGNRLRGHAFATSFTPERAAFNTTWPQLVDVPGTLLLVAETAEGKIVGYLLASTHLTFLANGPVAYLSLASRRAGPFYQALDYKDSAVFFKKNLP